jgi:hypothetical protein
MVAVGVVDGIQCAEVYDDCCSDGCCCWSSVWCYTALQHEGGVAVALSVAVLQLNRNDVHN